jgi:hypothetical protein
VDEDEGSMLLWGTYIFSELNVLYDRSLCLSQSRGIEIVLLDVFVRGCMTLRVQLNREIHSNQASRTL